MDTDALRTVLKSQYHAALAMLKNAIEKCPHDLWQGSGHTNECWQVAYHVLFFAHMYSQPNEAAFRPWKHHVANVQYQDGIAGPPDPKSTLPLLAEPYPKEQVLEYWAFVDAMIDAAVDVDRPPLCPRAASGGTRSRRSSTRSSTSATSSTTRRSSRTGSAPPRMSGSTGSGRGGSLSPGRPPARASARNVAEEGGLRGTGAAARYAKIAATGSSKPGSTLPPRSVSCFLSLRAWLRGSWTVMV